MNYYPFNVGDYAAHTAHLDLLEDLAYRRMLDLYYRTEQPLPSDWRQIARLIRMKDQGAEIEAVLAEFFALTDAGWTHGRCDSEIERMQDKQTKAKASAAASVKARSTNVQRTLNERSADVELPTPTPTPTPTPKNSAQPDGFAEFWSEYPRKVGKDAALKAFAKRKPGRDLLSLMLLAIRSQCQSVAWQKDEGQFIPHPATWLNEGRWQDEETTVLTVVRGPDPELERIKRESKFAAPPSLAVLEQMARIRQGARA